MTGTFEDEIEKNGRIIYTNVGDSMLPLLRQRRDLIIIEKPVGRCKKYDVPLCKLDSGRYVLHRVLKVREDGYIICGDNRWQCEYGITDRHIIGVLTGFVRDGVTYSVNDRRYKLYVHIRCDFFPIRAAVLWVRDFFRRLVRRFSGRE